ncbi:glycosyltransferase [Fertoebacter nigrum]|uniref:Glycosyltransferase n=1 Tax=Fertoeibacter niger TaxID=2656921 RepID=A0A8X8H3F9_9RHOB|nr:glycosyltransferase [Fertoeibacter niger]NUB46525.1 glycosyltransferase [Fertoeibacter niger]
MADIRRMAAARAELEASGLFDADWYAETYPDVAFAGMDPVDHFLWLGQRLGRSPGPGFDAAAYLARYHDVARSAMGPVLHYIRYGRKEGRVAQPVRLWEPALRDDVLRQPRVTRLQGQVPRVAGQRTVLLCAHVVGDTLYGSERSLFDMIDGLRAIGCNVIVTVPVNRNAAYVALLQTRCVAVLELAYGWWRAEVPVDEALVAAFARILADERIDILHANTIMLREPLIAARRLGLPAIVHARELIRHDAELQQMIGLDAASIVTAVWSRCDRVIANSQATADCFAMPGRRPHVVYNTADLATLTALPGPRLGGPLRVGMIGSNVPKKGLADFTAVAAAVAARGSGRGAEAEFVLIGPRHQHTEAVEEAVRSGTLPASLRVAGYRNTPAEAMAEVDLVLSLSQFQESFGRTVLEAMAAARPVIVYDHGAPPELLRDGQTGHVVPFGDTAAVAERICALAADRKALLVMGLKARDHAAAAFGAAAYAQAMGAAYAGLLEDSPRPAPQPMTLRARDLPARIARSDLKLAYFCWHFPVPSETFVLNELRLLRAQGIDVRVFCKASPYPGFTPDFPIEWEQVKDPGHLAQRLQETGRDVVHAHFVYPTVTDMVWPAAEQARIPFTCIAHAQDIFRYASASRNRIDEFARSPWCRQIFTLSQFHRQYLIDRGVPADRITINSNAIDPDLFAGGKIADRPARAARRICAVSRFAEKKGLDLLIRAGKLLEPDGIGIDIHGYGPLEDSYRRLIADEAIGNVVLHGPVATREDLLAVFRSHDLFACPSLRAADGDMDGIPTTLMESMAAGLPVLTTPVAGIPDLVQDGLTGLLCEATPDSIAAAIRAFYALEAEAVQAMIADAEAQLRRNHHGERLVDTLLRFWTGETIDLMIVSWNNLNQTREVIRRLYANTALPFHLIVCDNGSDAPALAHLLSVYGDHGNMTLILNRANAFVGPGTNLCMAQGTSDYMIYVCGKEGMTTAHGWEKPFVAHMDANPQVGQAGTLCYSPSYMTGRDYPAGVRLFAKFRNPGFATGNPDRPFRHVQGGFFVIRRAMVDAIGGFSDAVPHDYTDVEFSYHAESHGWALGEVPGLMALFNKTRPELKNRVDETHAALHPPQLADLPWLDRIARREVRHCNICGTQGPAFRGGDALAECPGCGSDPQARALFRALAESTQLYRRLPALGVGLPAALRDFWTGQFQGPVLDRAAFLDACRGGKALPNATGRLHLAALCGAFAAPDTQADVAAEVARLLRPGGVLYVQDATPRARLEPLLAAAGFTHDRQLRYTSAVIRFARSGIGRYIRNGATTAPDVPTPNPQD